MGMKEICRGVVCSRPAQHYGWPGITRTLDGDVLVGASERKHHVCPFGRVVVMRSSNNGKSWSLPMEIYNSELDDRDCTLATLPDGTVLVSWFTDAGWMQPEVCREEWQPRRTRVTARMLDELVGDWLLRSYDGGKTWEKFPSRLPPGAAEHSSPFVRRDGTLVCFAYEKTGDGLEMFFYSSRDKGMTWETLGRIPSGGRVPNNFPWELCRGQQLLCPRINERAFLEVDQDHYLAVFRTKGWAGNIVASHSMDGGKNWTDPAEIGIVGKAPHLLRMSCGYALCAYTHRAEPWSIRAVLSRDGGHTWETNSILTLDEWKDHPDMGYPVSLETAPNEVLTVYYCSRQPHHMPAYEKTFRKGSTPEGILYVKYKLIM